MSQPNPATHASICFFNNKGGVGKTTLACNVASFLAQHEDMRVLIVDADPQCNATQLVLPEETTAAVYAGKTEISTLRDVLAPLAAGDASLNQSFVPATASTNRFGVSILPGHPQIALLEDLLSMNWGIFTSGSLGGARVSNWNTQFLKRMGDQYDLVVYDVGPSLGALNRSVLIGTDYFVAPMGCDIFSTIGVENIATWLSRWQQTYEQGLERCRQDHRDEIAKYEIKTSASEMSRFLGYTVQQYITKTIRKERRATSAYEAILAAIPAKIKECLETFVPGGIAENEYRLGDVPHMYSLVPLAQTAHTPIHGLTSSDGLSGGQYAQHDEYKKFIAALANSLLRNLKGARAHHD